MSREIKRYRLHILERRAEPEDLEAQVRALRELQKQPGFIAAKPVSKKKGNRFFSISKEKWVYILHLFSRNKHKPGLRLKTKGSNSNTSRKKNIP